MCPRELGQRLYWSTVNTRLGALERGHLCYSKRSESSDCTWAVWRKQKWFCNVYIDPTENIDNVRKVLEFIM